MSRYRPLIFLTYILRGFVYSYILAVKHLKEYRIHLSRQFQD